MKNFRSALVAVVATASIAALVTPALADRDAVTKAKSDLERIQAESSALDQQIIEASSRADEAAAKLVGINADLKKQKAKVAKLSDELGKIAMVQFQSGGLEATTQLLTSDSASNFLSSLSVIEKETARSNANLQGLQVEQATLDRLQADADRTNTAMQKDLKAKQDLALSYDAKEAEGQAIYNRLSAEERQRLQALEAERQRQQDEADRLARERARQAASRSREATAPAPAGSTESTNSSTSAPSKPTEESPATSVDSSASSRAQRAIQVGLSKVGRPYVWGASGPSSFDCSGFTSWVYRQVGISLPRTSRAQAASAGYRVSKSDLRPGDLVFFYFPVSHVGIYIGDGKIVDSGNRRSGVRVIKLNMMKFNSARRVAG